MKENNVILKLHSMDVILKSNPSHEFTFGGDLSINGKVLKTIMFSRLGQDFLVNNVAEIPLWAVERNLGH